MPLEPPADLPPEQAEMFETFRAMVSFMPTEVIQGFIVFFQAELADRGV